jgi:hypothetical protein
MPLPLGWSGGIPAGQEPPQYLNVLLRAHLVYQRYEGNPDLRPTFSQFCPAFVAERLVLIDPLGSMSFDLILGLCIGFCLPLHVARLIGAAAFQRTDVIDDVARPRAGSPAGGRAAMAALEGSPGRRVPLNPSV